MAVVAAIVVNVELDELGLVTLLNIGGHSRPGLSYDVNVQGVICAVTLHKNSLPHIGGLWELFMVSLVCFIAP